MRSSNSFVGTVRKWKGQLQKVHCIDSPYSSQNTDTIDLLLKFLSHICISTCYVHTYVSAMKPKTSLSSTTYEALQKVRHWCIAPSGFHYFLVTNIHCNSHQLILHHHRIITTITSTCQSSIHELTSPPNHPTTTQHYLLISRHGATSSRLHGSLLKVMNTCIFSSQPAYEQPACC